MWGDEASSSAMLTHQVYLRWQHPSLSTFKPNTEVFCFSSFHQAVVEICTMWAFFFELDSWVFRCLTKRSFCLQWFIGSPWLFLALLLKHASMETQRGLSPCAHMLPRDQELHSLYKCLLCQTFHTVWRPGWWPHPLSYFSSSFFLFSHEEMIYCFSFT